MKGIVKKRTMALLLTLAVFPIAAGYSSWFGAGSTPDKTARTLVHDEKMGGRATGKAIQHGDAILPLIRRESEDFTLLNSRNTLRIAEVLAAIRTDQSHAMLTDLYSRTDPIARLVGAVGLARCGDLPGPFGEGTLLVTTVREDRSQTETQLAITALGWAKDKEALPCLLDLLKRRPTDYSYHAKACVAVARIRSADATPVLRDCLASEEFHALPHAFRALVALGDREAVPLAIARVTPEIREYNSGLVVRELKKVTGKSYGYNRASWEEWWDSVKTTWQIPEEFTKPWDEQRNVH